MRKIILAAPLLLAACQTGQVGSVISTAVGIQQDVCMEGSAIQQAATSPEGLATAAQAGVAATKVLGRVGKLNGYLQAYCTLGAPLTAAIAGRIQTASAQVLATNAAPPALVAAAKGQ